MKHKFVEYITSEIEEDVWEFIPLLNLHFRFKNKRGVFILAGIQGNLLNDVNIKISIIKISG
ncbi:hypothetical protein [Bacillus sp. J33]|uniref:hypothetical protein n=1 Tax=Bacillus sp. J33 TaxID=935836 RepID=UPI000478D219|nr:hypothetical protein [Bacillus sp. J33]